MRDNRDNERDDRVAHEGNETSSPYDTAPADDRMPEFRPPDESFERDDVYGAFPTEGEAPAPEAAPPAEDAGAPMPVPPAVPPAGEHTGRFEPHFHTDNIRARDSHEEVAPEFSEPDDAPLPETARPHDEPAPDAPVADKPVFEAPAADELAADEPELSEHRSASVLDSDEPHAPVDDHVDAPVDEPVEEATDVAAFAGPGAVAAGTAHVAEADEAGVEEDSPLTARRAEPAEDSPWSRASSYGGTAEVADIEDDGKAHARTDDDDIESTMVRRTSLWNSESGDDAPASYAPGAAAAGAGAAGTADPATTTSEPRTQTYEPHDPASRYEDDILAGEELEAPRSRVGAHIASIFLVLLLTPIAWYLIADAGARFTLASNAPWDTGTINLAAIGEMVGGLLLVVLIAILVKASSVGAWITGALLAIVGAAYVVAPGMLKEYSTGPLDKISDLHQIGANAAHHFLADVSTGRMLAYGVALLLAGYISHAARRAGRRGERLQAAFERRVGH